MRGASVPIQCSTEPGRVGDVVGAESGFTMPEAEVRSESRRGYRFSMQPPDDDLSTSSGEVVEIDLSEEPPRLTPSDGTEPIPDDSGNVVTLTLDAAGGSTVIALSQGWFTTEERRRRTAAAGPSSFQRLRDAIASPS